MSRPPESASSVANRFAMCTGLWRAVSKTAAPSRMRVVTAAAYVRSSTASRA